MSGEDPRPVVARPRELLPMPLVFCPPNGNSGLKNCRAHSLMHTPPPRVSAINWSIWRSRRLKM